ncbi:MAG TPA: hypothetical protein VNP03_26420 [Pseudonocardia sp.]|nr:hypothetical protein [Pseudonocardia sp.]
MQARAGGWLVRSPTGAVTDCAGLGELVTAVGRWLGTPSDFAAGSPPSGRLLLPSPDARRGIRLRVDPSAAVRGLAEECETVVVPDDERALGVLAELSRPPWSARRYLTEVTVAGVTRAEVTRAGVTRAGVTGAAAGWAGVTGAAAGWAAAPTPVRAPSAAHAADLLLWLEHGRRSGRWDDAALAAHCPLEDTADGSGGAELYVEVRAGHVVRAGCRDHRSDLRV